MEHKLGGHVHRAIKFQHRTPKTHNFTLEHEYQTTKRLGEPVKSSLRNMWHESCNVWNHVSTNNNLSSAYLHLTGTKIGEINNIISTYISGPHQTTLSVQVISQTRVNGGYNITDIPLYADLYYIKPLTPFLRFRLTNEILPQSLQQVEYNEGLQISNLFRTAQNNITPRTAHRNSLTLLQKATADCGKIQNNLRRITKWKHSGNLSTHKSKNTLTQNQN